MLIKEPKLAVGRRSHGPITGLRFYYVQTGRPGEKSQHSTATVESKEKGNVADLLVPPDRLEIKIYFSKTSCERIRGVAGPLQAAEIHKEMESIMLPTAKEILNGLLSRLKIPSFAIGGIVSQVLSWALKTSRSDLPKIVQGFLKESGKGEAGETIIIDLQLPGELFKKPN